MYLYLTLGIDIRNNDMYYIDISMLISTNYHLLNSKIDYTTNNARLEIKF